MVSGRRLLRRFDLALQRRIQLLCTLSSFLLCGVSRGGIKHMGVLHIY
jgi:hypothetical protein